MKTILRLFLIVSAFAVIANAQYASSYYLGPDTKTLSYVQVLDSAVYFKTPFTAYSIDDVVSDTLTGGKLLKFQYAAKANGQGGFINGGWVQIDTGVANVNFRLHLYSDTVTVTADNAAFVPLWQNRYKYIGFVDFFTETIASGTGYSIAVTTSKPLFFRPRANATAIYGVLTTKTAFTGKRNGKLFIGLNIIR